MVVDKPCRSHEIGSAKSRAAVDHARPKDADVLDKGLNQEMAHRFHGKKASQKRVFITKGL